MKLSTKSIGPVPPVFRVQVVVEQDGDDAFYAHCPQLGCIHVSGETLQEAQEAVIAAVQVYLEMSFANGDPIPIGVQETKPLRTKAPVAPTRRLRRDEFVDVSLAAAL
jgi:predicted RNase H-like HicB family nuclease